MLKQINQLFKVLNAKIFNSTDMNALIFSLTIQTQSTTNSGAKKLFLAPLHIKKSVAIVELKVKILPSLLQCTAIYGCVLQLRAKKKNSFFILQSIKIIFVCLFFSILLFYNHASLRKNTLNSLNSLKLTLSNSHLSVSLPSA